MTKPPEFDRIDWSLTTWEGSRRAQMEQWAKMSLDRILEAQEEMAEVSANLARQATELRVAANHALDNSRAKQTPVERINAPVGSSGNSRSNGGATSEVP